MMTYAYVSSRYLSFVCTWCLYFLAGTDYEGTAKTL